MKTTHLVSSAALALTIAGSASAAVFGPATGVIAVLGSPTVTLGAASGSAAFSAPVSLFGTTGDLSSASGTGTALGTLDFLDTPLTVLPESITDFMTFADTSGGSYTFDISSVETIAYSSTPASTSITLYLLGLASDSHLGLSPGPTSETITINKTGLSAYSASATIAAPPSMGTPEPASWALMLIGFGVSGGLLRRSRKLQAAI